MHGLCAVFICPLADIKARISFNIGSAIDFGFIYDEVRHLYCSDNGRVSIDPVVLFKIVLIQYTFGIRSMRQTIKEIEAKHYQEELEREIENDRENHGKKPLKPRACISEPKTKTVKKSKTDPDCGLFHKGEHNKEFAYTTHVACDKHGFVLEADVSAGNIHDSVMFDDVYKNVTEKFPEIEMVGLDSGYRTPWIMKQVFDSGRLPSIPYKRPMTKEGFFKKYDYIYDEYYDCILCPNHQVLKYSTTNREGYREYKSDPKICIDCPVRSQCTKSKNAQKVVTRHVWENYIEDAEDVRHSDKGKEIYKLRKETIERVFADAKVKHGLRYTQYRGLARLKMQVLLTFACMNLKKLANWKRKSGLLPPKPANLFYLFAFIPGLLHIFE